MPGGAATCSKGDVVLVTRMEHHANIVPLANGLRSHRSALEPVNVLEDGTLDLDDFHALLERTSPKWSPLCTPPIPWAPSIPCRTVPAAKRCRRPDLGGWLTGLPHMAIDVQAIGCDFYVATAHKAYGPTGLASSGAKRTT